VQYRKLDTRFLICRNPSNFVANQLQGFLSIEMDLRWAFIADAFVRCAQTIVV